MAIVRPFKGLRPTKEMAEKVACPPYDVVDREEAFNFAKDNPFSFLHITRSEIDLPQSIDEHDDKVYQKAGENLQQFLEKKILVQDAEPFYYIYRQEWKGHIQTGIVGCVSCEEYEKGIVRKHEFTRKDKEEDRTKHILATGLNTGPVFLTYKDNHEINSLTSEFIIKNTPEYSVKDENDVLHILWVIRDSQTNKKLYSLFEKIDVLYVADGHHRSASATNVYRMKKGENPNHTGMEEYGYFLSIIFPADQLKILSYNRVVKDLNGLDNAQFMEKLSSTFDIKPDGAKEPETFQEISMYLDHQWYSLKTKKEKISIDPVKSLDVSILQDNVLSGILGIKDPRTDNRIKFVGGIRGVKELEKLVDSGKFEVAFSMYPTSIDQLINVASQNQIMPPKSTWFEPKLRSGLVIHTIND